MRDSRRLSRRRRSWKKACKAHDHVRVVERWIDLLHRLEVTYPWRDGRLV